MCLTVPDNKGDSCDSEREEEENDKDRCDFRIFGSGQDHFD